MTNAVVQVHGFNPIMDPTERKMNIGCSGVFRVLWEALKNYWLLNTIPITSYVIDKYNQIVDSDNANLCFLVTRQNDSQTLAVFLAI